METIHISLQEETVPNKVEFLRLLNEAKIPEAKVKFTKWESGLFRDIEGSTLDSFLENIPDEIEGAALQLGGVSHETIRYALFWWDKNERRTAEYECPLNETSYEVIQELFEQVYGRNT